MFIAWTAKLLCRLFGHMLHFKCLRIGRETYVEGEACYEVEYVYWCRRCGIEAIDERD